jgi:hypothetical protein
LTGERLAGQVSGRGIDRTSTEQVASYVGVTRTKLAEFTAQLAEWIWALLSSALQSRGIRLDPQEPIPAPAREI